MDFRIRTVLTYATNLVTLQPKFSCLRIFFFWILLKNDENPISLQERDCRETNYPKNEKTCVPIVLTTKLATRGSSGEESGTRNGGGGCQSGIDRVPI